MLHYIDGCKAVKIIKLSLQIRRLNWLKQFSAIKQTMYDNQTMKCVVKVKPILSKGGSTPVEVS